MRFQIVEQGHGVNAMWVVIDTLDGKVWSREYRVYGWAKRKAATLNEAFGQESDLVTVEVKPEESDKLTATQVAYIANVVLVAQFMGTRFKYTTPRALKVKKMIVWSSEKLRFVVTRKGRDAYLAQAPGFGYRPGGWGWADFDNYVVAEDRPEFAPPEAVKPVQPAKLVQVRPGFWSCCRANPSKMVEFRDDYDRPVWRYACPGCASTVEQERVKDAGTLGFMPKYMEFGRSISDCTSEDERFNEGSRVLGPVRYALRMARAAREHGLTAMAARYLRESARLRMLMAPVKAERMAAA